MKKISIPSKVKILDFWCSNKGKEILEGHNIKPYGIHTLTIDAGEECWCCDAFCCEGYYDGWRKDEKNGIWSGDSRERCHIVAKSLGGSYECSNLFLMCEECHRRAPNTIDSRIFFEWVVKTNRKAIQYRKDLINGMAELSKELFHKTFPDGKLDFKSESYEQWQKDVTRFTTEFYGKDFSKYCDGKIGTHGYGGRYHPDILNSELGLYKQYCKENWNLLFSHL